MLVQPITNQNNYNFHFPKFKGNSQVLAQTVAGADSFVKSSEKPIFTAIKDVLNFLKINAGRIANGKIFNEPVTRDGDSLLMALVHIIPLQEEENDYAALLYKMSKMPDINYDQKDSIGMSALEWVMTSENRNILDLMKGKILTIDPVLDSTYSRIKNPEFKKALIESGVYIPPSIESAEEQELIVSSVLRKKHDRITSSAIRNIVINMQDNNGNISHETVNIFKRILNISKADDIDELHEVMNLLKDSSGNTDAGKAADFLAVYSREDSSIDDAIKYVGDKYKLAYKVKVDPRKEKEENEIIERFKQYVDDCSRHPSVTSARMMEQMVSQHYEILNRKCPEYVGFYNNQKMLDEGGVFSRASLEQTPMRRSQNVLDSLLDAITTPYTPRPVRLDDYPRSMSVNDLISVLKVINGTYRR